MSDPDLKRGTAQYWLTSRRLRAHAGILAVCLWSLYVWNLAMPGLRDRSGNLKGTDFLHFYTLGALAGEQRGGDLYNMNAQATLAAERVPEAAGMRYLPLYPPQVSILFAPLARLPYAWALALWWIFSATIYAGCVFAAWRACPNLHGFGLTVLIAAIGFPAFFHLIAWGQTSALALACFTGAFFLLKTSVSPASLLNTKSVPGRSVYARREFFAGLVLGCLIFKPQLAVASAIVFLSIGAWRVLGGAILSAVAQMGIGVLYYGVGPLRQWFRVMTGVRGLFPLLEPKPYQTHCLRTFWSMLIPGTVSLAGTIALALYIASAAAVLWWTISIWRRSAAPVGLRYSSLLCATVLVAPHLTVYDLVILAPAFLLTADWLLERALDSRARTLGTLLYFVYMLALVGPLTRWTHVQLSVIAMTACVYSMWSISRRGIAAERIKSAVHAQV